MNKRNAVLLSIVAVVMLGMLFRWTARSRRADDMSNLECTQLYATATTHAESVLVDSTHPTQQPRGSTRRLTCGELR